MATIPAPATSHKPSLLQEQLWFLERLLPNRAVYNVPLGMRLRGPLERAALDAAVNAVVERHEQLRAVFPDAGGTPAMRIVPDVRVRLREGKESYGSAELLELLTRTAREAFDLERGPLIRALLVECGPDDHVLLLVMHHIVSDGWTLRIIFEDLAACYGARVRHEEARLAPSGRSFVDFAAAEREAARDGRLESSRGYWASTLGGAPRVELLGDRSAFGMSSFEGSTVTLGLRGKPFERLSAFARAAEATPTMVLLAAYAALISRYTTEEDLVVGVPTYGRYDPAYERTVGYFVSMAALRLDAGGDPTFEGLVERTRGALLDSLSQPPPPMQLVVERLSPQRRGLRNPLFSLAYVTQIAIEPLTSAGVRFETIAVSTNTAKFDVLLEAMLARGGVTCAFHYATDLYDRTRIESFARSYRSLLEGAFEDPRRPLSRIRLLDAREEAGLTRAPAPIAKAYARTPILRRFELQAAARPQATALLFGGERVTYGGLDEAATRLARRLNGRGAEPGTFVGICAERSPLLVTAILAVLKSGAAYVPLDPRYPQSRLSFIARDAGVALVLTDAPSRAKAEALDVEVVQIDAEDDEADDAEPFRPAFAPASNDVEYVIYTSGSTGAPKGVAVTHANVARLFAGAESIYDFGASDVWALFHSYAFDFSVWELWGALAHGGALVIVPAQTVRDPQAFHALLLERGVTVLNQTPSAFYELVAADRQSERLEALRYVIFGGEELDVRRLAPWFGRYGDERPQLVNMYGITETTVHVSHRRIRRDDERRALSPIGVPLPDLQMYLLDRHGALVPDGAIGEIYVAGAGVARGYLNRDDLDREKFLADPFDPASRRRMYRSGDLARRRFDGRYEYVGRADDQVKVRGFRIELAEIEAALATHPAVERAVVLAECGPADARLCAYVVPRAGAVDVTALREHLAAALPAHMLPNAFATLDAIPLTESGKLDRKALAAAAKRLDAAGSAEPANEAERRLAAVFAQTLGIERAGADDNFFAIGGHSLLAARLVHDVEAAFPNEAARLRTSAGRSPLLAAFYADPTVRGLGMLLRGERELASQARPIVEMRSGDPARAPLFWFHGMYNGDGLYTWNLVGLLSRSRPVWIVHPHGYDNTPFRADVTMQAGERLELIRSVRPHGPYHLGGFCNGALIAYEIAVRLRAAGEHVASLVLVNPPPLRTGRVRLLALTKTVAQTLHLSESTRLLVAGYISRYADRLDAFGKADARGRINSARRAVDLAARKVRRLAQIATPKPRSTVPSYADPQFKNDRYGLAMAEYLPPPYPAPVHVIWGDDLAHSLDEPTGGWSQFAACVNAHVVTGSHFCVVENPRAIAALLRDAVEGEDYKTGTSRRENT